MKGAARTRIFKSQRSLNPLPGFKLRAPLERRHPPTSCGKERALTCEESMTPFTRSAARMGGMRKPIPSATLP
ncbi:protein of unknown function (plasmid) [Cupriavidus taiwanensis]|uniref:Uncharacterized protein n=1 Tax=Cupriavidus taiwanensis TaxID=164546 RepID=A0A9Q7UYE3_9BURK|nr:protein of unknown function [Cupriavidus taiwanensis]